MLTKLKYTNSKQKNSEINAASLCLGIVSKDYLADNMKKTGLYEYIYDFSVNYDSIAVHDILDIHKYFMKELDLKCLDLSKKCLLG